MNRETKKARPMTSPRQSVPASLIAGGCRRRQHVNPFAAFVELHLAIDQREQGPVAARSDILAGNELRAPLADEDAARGDKFTAKTFHAQPLADAVASVADAAAAFLVCHKTKF
jgi:hypothetical protein